MASPSGNRYGNRGSWEAQRDRLRTEEEWVGLFEQQPHVITDLLGDIFREVRAERARAAGRPQIGRRPRVIDGSMDELWAMITPRYSTEPFPTALAEVQGTLSRTRLAALAKLPRRTIEHMLEGKVPLEMYRLERIAGAVDVSPAYFREWREGYVLATIAELLAVKPALGVQFARGLIGAARQRKDPQ